MQITFWSQPARAVWIEIQNIEVEFETSFVTACEGCVDWNIKEIEKRFEADSHSLRGLCGLKLSGKEDGVVERKSQPARAVWIEIIWSAVPPTIIIRHSLRGLCGLKYLHAMLMIPNVQSQPARAVWIEIYTSLRRQRPTPASQPARAVWIEMFSIPANSEYRIVTACEGCVDWNPYLSRHYLVIHRHSLRGLCGLKYRFPPVKSGYRPSQPARAVWIEILSQSVMIKSIGVTACEGCVDWNIDKFAVALAYERSQPARAVWIEIGISV